MYYTTKEIKEILSSVESPYDNYCAGHQGQSSYVAGVVIGSAATSKKLGHGKSRVLDHINTFDMAEVDNAYLGQINMIRVSSFCGPSGLLWGHDLAKEESFKITDLLTKQDLSEFKNIKIAHGKNLRKAAKELFGTRDKKVFPFRPGEHVFAAKKMVSAPGPIIAYGAIAVGIPEKRREDAVLFMENVGFMTEGTEKEKRGVLKKTIESVMTIGKNQKVSYEMVYADIVSQKIKEGEYGGALVAAPYFLLPKNAYTSPSEFENLKKWKKSINL